MTVDDMCRRLNNRLGAPLVFEGRLVKDLIADQSVCRQLFERYAKDVSYEGFKDVLRFHMQNGMVVASLASKPAPNNSLMPNKPLLRPAVFKNVNNSCYFHSAMLMLYQMRGWYRTRRCLPNRLLYALDDLLQLMEAKDHISASELQDAYSLVQKEVFPGQVNRQQDANEFFMSLFKVMVSAKCDMEPLSFVTIAKTFEPADSPDMVIQSLVFKAKPLDANLVEEFTFRWVGLPPDKRKLSEWTVVDGDIVERDAHKRNGKKSNYQPEISRADANRFGQLDFDTQEPTVRQTTEQTSQILNLVLPADRSDVCQLVADVLAKGQVTVSQVQPKNQPQALFNLKTKAEETYARVAQFLMVLMVYDPRTVIAGRQFTCTDSILVGADRYALTCVIYRSGDNAGGHYTAAVRTDGRWMYYDDVSETRVPVPSLVGSRVPFMLLFQKNLST